MWEGAPHPASGKKDIVGLYPANMGLHHVVTLTLDGCVLLDGRRATTHWALAAQLADRFPQVMVDAGVLYVDDDDVLTSAGVAAGLDLCLHVVRRDHGAATAASIARRFRAETGTTPLQWILAQRVLLARQLLEQTDLPVESVAHACGFSTAPHLRRHFTRAPGNTPTAYRSAFTLRS